MDFSGVIFDMDGLVVDSEAGYSVAWQRAAQDLGYQLSGAFCESLSGASGSMVKERICGHFGDNFDWAEFAERSAAHWYRHANESGIPVKPGFAELIDVLQRGQLPYCLATNSRRADVEQCLAWAGIADIFTVKVTRDDVMQPKPAPDVFWEASRLLGLPSSRCLVLEDSRVGVQAALAAGCPCIWVPSQSLDAFWTQSERLRIVDDLHQVARFVSSLLGDSL